MREFVDTFPAVTGHVKDGWGWKTSTLYQSYTDKVNKKMENGGRERETERESEREIFDIEPEARE
jgi:hypothetical protein